MKSEGIVRPGFLGSTVTSTGFDSLPNNGEEMATRRQMSGRMVKIKMGLKDWKLLQDENHRKTLLHRLKNLECRMFWRHLKKSLLLKFEPLHGNRPNIEVNS
jgi:hypothetical protein